MSLFNRLCISVHSTMERTLARMENHEAVVDAGLADSQAAVTRARLQLGRLEKDGTQLRERLQKLTTEIEKWNERARSVAASDREKALSCIQRRRECEQSLLDTQAQLEEHDTLMATLRDSVNESLGRVQSLQQQLVQMRTREAAAAATQTVSHLKGHQRHDVDLALARWEEVVGTVELMNEGACAANTTDSFEQEFLSTEHRDELETELDKLLSNENGHHGQ